MKIGARHPYFTYAVLEEKQEKAVGNKQPVEVPDVWHDQRRVAC